VSCSPPCSPNPVAKPNPPLVHPGPASTVTFTSATAGGVTGLAGHGQPAATRAETEHRDQVRGRPVHGCQRFTTRGVDDLLASLSRDGAICLWDSQGIQLHVFVVDEVTHNRLTELHANIGG